MPRKDRGPEQLRNVTLVANFTGNDAGKLPCPVMLIPGSLSDERLEQLS